jgi:hypothetical protein
MERRASSPVRRGISGATKTLQAASLKGIALLRRGDGTKPLYFSYL